MKYLKFKFKKNLILHITVAGENITINKFIIFWSFKPKQLYSKMALCINNVFFLRITIYFVTQPSF